MKTLRVSTWLHKWIALVVGIQVLFWVGGGLVMTVIPIERVRSEHRIAEVAATPLPLASVISPAEAAAAAEIIPVEARLRASPRGPVWTLTAAGGETTVTVSATTGRPRPAMSEAEARRLAQAAYRGEGRTVSARLLSEAPQETGRTGPIWRVDFDNAERTTFYLSPETGEVVTRRSAVWRFYDFFWRLHIMDLENGEDFNHPLIIVATALTLIIVVTGFILLWIRLGRDLKSAVAGRRQRPRP